MGITFLKSGLGSKCLGNVGLKNVIFSPRTSQRLYCVNIHDNVIIPILEVRFNV